MFKKLILLLLIMLQTILEPVSQNVSFFNNHFEGTENLKILSWNIYMLPYLSLFNGNTKRANLIAEELHNSDYQIIVFQEAFSSVCRGILSKRLKDTYPYQYGPANKNHPPLKTNSGLWIVSKIPLEELDEIRYSISKGYDAVAHKGAVIFQGNYQGSEFQLVTTHLQAENLPEIRKQQCKEMKEKLLNKYYNPLIPQIICGDFNIDMDDHENYPFLLKTLDAKNGEVKGDSTTYDEVFNTLSQERTGKRRIIDYVLVRNLEWFHNIERKVNTFYVKSSNYSGNLSDHYAIEASILFTPHYMKNMAMN
ncbi:Endonuclease/exonuclease/phosphatase [uncultured Paludibacter sp.]|uniref:Endonuclease/exonuclease/phosphatase n=1 Tax=uncultured Paludibacter sp. TaxID=497635 RepID=A0A653AJS3_9BACT|nr:Endonuclease/exonuclease/phosphatase [uncultured Paludibacter sp.]